MLPRWPPRATAAAALLASLSACAASPMLRAARDGDRAALAAAAAEKHARGKVTLGEAAEVAHAVAAREILGAKTPEEAVQRIREVRGCAFAVDDALAERMKVDDVAGGEAALARLEAGAIGPGAATDHAASSDDRWRAVAMEGMTGGDDHDARLRGLVDGSPAVRRAALRVIATRDDGSDVAAVLEAARKDPDPLVRGSAVRALGRMHHPPPGDTLAVQLRDIYTSASAGDDGLRADIAAVWASQSVAPAGGRVALAHFLATANGNAAVTLAGAILDADLDDPPLRAAATAALVAALKTGGHRARIHAIAVVPVGRGWPRRPVGESGAFLAALREVADAEDQDVRLAALGRLVLAGEPATDADRTAARVALEALAAPSVAPGQSALRASRARLLLADAGDRAVQAWIEADMQAKDAGLRTGAAEALAALGRASRAAPLLADEDASVRTQVACTILRASKVP